MRTNLTRWAKKIFCKLIVWRKISWRWVIEAGKDAREPQARMPALLRQEKRAGLLLPLRGHAATSNLLYVGRSCCCLLPGQAVRRYAAMIPSTALQDLPS